MTNITSSYTLIKKELLYFTCYQKYINGKTTPQGDQLSPAVVVPQSEYHNL